MADGLFGLGGPFGPMTPGGSGYINPMAMLGFGIYQGNPAQTLAQMAAMQQQGTQHAADLALRHAAETRAAEAHQAGQARQAGLSALAGSILKTSPMFSALAPDVAAQVARDAPEAVVSPYFQSLMRKPATTPAMTEAAVLYPGDPEAQKRYIEEARMKPETVVNLAQQTEKGKRISERAALVNEYGAYSPEVQRYDMSQLSATQVTNIGQIEPVRQMLKTIEDLTTGEEPAVDVDQSLLGLQAMAEASQFGTLVPGELTEAEARLVGDLERVENTILALARGAQVGPQEQEKFARQLPRVGQDPTLFKQNLEATRRNLEYLSGLYRTMAPSMFPKKKQGSGPQGEPIGTERVTPDGVRIRKTGPNRWERVEGY